MNSILLYLIKKSGRSWWQARYTDGKVVSEWDTVLSKVFLPLFLFGKSSHWEEVDKKGMVGLRLLCPNGQVGELEAPIGHRFFQLKSGVVIAGVGRYCDAHIIGVAEGSNGDCKCYSYETKNRSLLFFKDNVFDMKYRNIGFLNLDVQQLIV